MNKFRPMVLATLTLWILTPCLGSDPIPDPAAWVDQTRDMAARKMEALARSSAFSYRSDRGYDVTRYALFLTPDFTTRSLTARTVVSAESTIDALSVAQFDLGDRMTVLSIQSNGQDLPFTRTGSLLDITLDHPYSTGEIFSIDIVYTGPPRFWTFVFTDHQGLPMFSTMAEPNGAREWWPCNDQPTDKATVEVHATVPDWMEIASNGLQTGDVDHGDGTHTVSWSTDYVLATYLVSCAGADYARIDDTYVSQDGQTELPVPVFIPPDLEAPARIDFADTVDMIGFFARSFGEYPFMLEKYGQVAVNTGGGMEHQTITHINKEYISGHGLMNLVSHELAHMWWGDCITMETWPDIWLNEGFATYSAALYTEYRFGPAALDAIMTGYASEPFAGTVYDPVQLFGDTVYLKGAWVLHMLRDMLGDDLFFDILRTYFADDRFRFGNASTDDFISLCETVSARDLSWFFDQWLHRVDRPSLDVSWDYAPAGEGFSVAISIDQVQDDGLFYTLPMILRVVTDSGVFDSPITLDALHSTFDISVEGIPRAITLDPDNHVLKWVNPGPSQFRITNERRLASAAYGAIYSEQIDTANGTPPITMSLVQGTLPPGITLSADGAMSGFPIQSGTYSFTLQAVDSRGYPMTARSEHLIKVGVQKFTAALACNQTEYASGDRFTVRLSLENRTGEPLDLILYMILDVADEFLFISPIPAFPSFSSEPFGYAFISDANFTASADIFDFIVPDSAAGIDGAFHCGSLNPANGSLWGALVTEPFSIR